MDLSLQERKQAISDWLEKHKHLPEQGSEEWLLARKNTIGGSQIATVLGVNKYENVQALVKEKTGVSPFKKAAPLWFGSIMERCVEQYVGIRYDAETFETGSLPSKWKHISYSPDGLCVVHRKLLGITDEEYAHIKENSVFQTHGDYVVVLMEFKSPYRRIPLKDKIPEYYLPQPLLGMDVIEIAEMAIFIECVFRFCGLEQLKDSSYSRYHYDKNRYTDHIAFGIISIKFNANTSDEVKETVASLKTQTADYKQMDAGTIQSKELDKLMEIMCSNQVHVEYSDMIYCKATGPRAVFFKYLQQDQIEKFSSNCELFLPYKLYDVNEVNIMKTPIVSDKLVTAVDKIVDAIEKISSLPLEDRADAIKKHSWSGYTL